MNLYEMTETAKQLMQLFEDGDIPEDAINDTLEGIGVQDKLEDYCKVIKSFEYDMDNIDKEIERLKSAKERTQKAIDRLTKALRLFAVTEYLATTKSRKATAGTFALSLRKSESVQITNESKIPEKFIVTKTTVKTTPDKTAIKKFLKENEENTLEGAMLVVNENLQIK